MKLFKTFRTVFFAVLAASPHAVAGSSPAGSVHPRIAVVIDDFGLTYAKDVPDAEWMKIPWPITFAVMPESPRTREAAAAIRAAGHELIIHFPFDPFLRLELPPGRISPEDLSAISKLLDKAFRQIPSPAGLNNHRSFRATQNRPLMAAFMERLKGRGVYFLDSHVSPKSVAFDEARGAGIAAVRNDIFLDGAHEPKARRAKDPSVLQEAIAKDKAVCEKYLKVAAAKARKTGAAVAIGHHYYHGTYECLMEMEPRLRREGFDFVFASALVER